MLVKQISVFLENKSGRLAEVTRVLGENGIDMIALSLADATDFGILRLIVNDPEKALLVLKECGFTVSSNDVISLNVEDVAGGLAKVLKILEDDNIGIEYMYAFVGKSKEATVIIRVEDINLALKALKITC